MGSSSILSKATLADLVGEVGLWIDHKYGSETPDLAGRWNHLEKRNARWWSSELRPTDAAAALLIERGMCDWSVSRNELAIQIVDYVNAARVKALVGTTPSVGLSTKGRLLAYFPDENLSDGAACVCSDGFFDVHNIPSWDTWVAFVPGTVEELSDGRKIELGVLLAWMPAALIPVAETAIEVNPEQCVAWADSVDRPELDFLR